jgi:pyruvate dehydrogenase E2 component (dihydrolipoamide acetyltransferase)
MAFSVVMPALEMAQETGKLIAWRKKEGDRVTKGEPLLEIETDKAVMEIEAPADGILAGITAQAGTDIPVGQTIAWIVAPGEKPPAESRPASAAPAARAKTESHAVPVAASTLGPSAVQSARISPKARRLAKELCVDLASLHGSGPGGEILASDVQGAAAAQAAKGTSVEKSISLAVPSTLARLMAERTAKSWTTVPHFFLSRGIKAADLNRYRARLASEIERAHGIRITHTHLLIALTARTLLKHPRLNSSWTAEGIRLHDRVNMAIAVAVKDGVVAAVVPNAHAASILEIATCSRELAERARVGKLRPADIADATFTISNLGMYGVDAFSAIITPPQAAVLAVGSIADRVVAVEGTPAVRQIMNLTLSCDHRVADGVCAADFLNDLAEAIGAPERSLA